MTSRRRWLRHDTKSSYTRAEYACLLEDSPLRQFSLKPRRSVVTKASSLPSATPWKSHAKFNMHSFHPPAAASWRSDNVNDLSNSDSECDDDTCTDLDLCNSAKAPICWPGVRVATEDRVWSKDTDDDEEDEMGHFTKPFTEKYYARPTAANSNDPAKILKKHRDDKLLTVRSAQSKCKLFLADTKVSSSQSFETQETQLEESSETSFYTTDDETDRSSKSSKQPTVDGVESKKRVRWPDEQSKGALITKVHALEYSSEIPYTCRVVILLLMDRGTQSEASNFEFLHCEFQQDDRLRVCDALPQITRLVLGAAPIDASSSSQPTEAFRPFTRLYLDGRELINTLALQDCCLEDGQSTLVALREPLINSRKADSKFMDKQRRDALLRQAEMLLADKRLRRGIRKARIAGRSLQILYGTQGILERKEQLLKASNSAEVENNEVEEQENVDTNEAPWSVFDNLARTSFDSDDLKDTSSFDVDFFEGRDFFRQLTVELPPVSTEQYHNPLGKDSVDSLDPFVDWTGFNHGSVDRNDVVALPFL